MQVPLGEGAQGLTVTLQRVAQGLAEQCSLAMQNMGGGGPGQGLQRNISSTPQPPKTQLPEANGQLLASGMGAAWQAWGLTWTPPPPQAIQRQPPQPMQFFKAHAGSGGDQAGRWAADSAAHVCIALLLAGGMLEGLATAARQLPAQRLTRLAPVLQGVLLQLSGAVQASLAGVCHWVESTHPTGTNRSPTNINRSTTDTNRQQPLPMLQLHLVQTAAGYMYGRLSSCAGVVPLQAMISPPGPLATHLPRLVVQALLGPCLGLGPLLQQALGAAEQTCMGAFAHGRVGEGIVTGQQRAVPGAFSSLQAPTALFNPEATAQWLRARAELDPLYLAVPALARCVVATACPAPPSLPSSASASPSAAVQGGLLEELAAGGTLAAQAYAGKS